MDELDCIIIGGGVAGLSAALTLGRARRRAVVVDSGRQSNLAAHAIGGLIGQDGRRPADLYAQVRAEVESHPTTSVRSGAVERAERDGDGFAFHLGDGSTLATARVVIATGMDYRIPEVEGFSARWGGTVFHCPFCHGWEVRGRPLAVHGSDAAAVHRGLLLRSWSDEVTVLTDGQALADDHVAQLAAAGVEVDDRPIAQVEGPGTELERVVFADGSTRACGGLLVHATMHQRDDLAAQLGLAIAEPGPIVHDAIVVDEMFATSVPRVWAAGDVASRMPSIVDSIAAGTRAGAMAVADAFAHG